MKYKAKVSQGFFDWLDSRPSIPERWWFEWPEYALGQIPNSGFTHLPDDMRTDASHVHLNKCDFKYDSKDKKLKLTNYVVESIEMGCIDTFILWKFLHRDPMKPVELDEIIKFEWTMSIDAKIVYNNTVYNKGTNFHEYLRT